MSILRSVTVVGLFLLGLSWFGARALVPAAWASDHRKWQLPVGGYEHGHRKCGFDATGGLAASGANFAADVAIDGGLTAAKLNTTTAADSSVDGNLAVDGGILQRGHVLYQNNDSLEPSNSIFKMNVPLVAGSTIQSIFPPFTSGAPLCFCTDHTANNACAVTASSTTSVTVIGTGIDIIGVICFGNLY